MRITEPIPARNMGHFDGGERPPGMEAYLVCPTCGGLMSPNAEHCMKCYSVENNQRQVDRNGLRESKMDNHHRFEAALLAGWSFDYLVRVRPMIPTWEEIAARDPAVVLKWHPEVVIERWWLGADSSCG